MKGLWQRAAIIALSRIKSTTFLPRQISSDEVYQPRPSSHEPRIHTANTQSFSFRMVRKSGVSTQLHVPVTHMPPDMALLGSKLRKLVLTHCQGIAAHSPGQ